MFQLIRALSTRELFVRQLPALSVAFLIASFFYRFGSFALESVAFLATWFVVDAVFEVGQCLLPVRRPALDRAQPGAPAPPS